MKNSNVVDREQTDFESNSQLQKLKNHTNTSYIQSFTFTKCYCASIKMLFFRSSLNTFHVFQNLQLPKPFLAPGFQSHFSASWSPFVSTLCPVFVPTLFPSCSHFLGSWSPLIPTLFPSWSHFVSTMFLSCSHFWGYWSHFVPTLRFLITLFPLCSPLDSHLLRLLLSSARSNHVDAQT